MADQRGGGIAWTDLTWNPLRGCSRVSEGCRNCYAEKVAYRFSGEGMPYEGLAVLRNGHASWTGKVELVEQHLLDPLRMGPVLDPEAPIVNSLRKDRSIVSARLRRRRIFVNSMSDLFHENVPDEWIDKIFAVMALCPQHIFQCLTKRPERMLPYLTAEGCWFRIQLASEKIVHGTRWKADVRRHRDPNFLDHVWLGVSAENQAAAEQRIPLLLQTPAAVRFISAEPLLGPIDMTRTVLIDHPAFAPGQQPQIHWVIVGGESGSGARPFDTQWAESIVRQCSLAGVACFVKQLGAHVIQGGERRLKKDRKGGDWNEWPHELRVRQFPEVRP